MYITYQGKKMWKRGRKKVERCKIKRGVLKKIEKDLKKKVEGNKANYKESKMEKTIKQMQKMLTNYRTELVKELSGKYGFGWEEALAYLVSKEPVEEEKRGRPAKKVKTLVTKEQEVDAVIMEMLEDSDPLTKKSESESKSNDGEKLDAKAKKETEKQEKADAKAKKEAEKQEKADAKAKKETEKQEKADAKAKKETEKQEKADAKAKKETEKQEKADAKAKKETEKQEKAEKQEKKEPKAKKADAVVTITENSPKTVTPVKKNHVGGFPFKNQATEPAEAVTSKDEEDEEADEYEEIEFEGKSYFRTTDNVVFDKETERGVGTWNEETKQIDFEEEEEEEEEWINE